MATTNAAVVVLDEDTFESTYQPVMTPGSDPDNGEVMWEPEQVERLTRANPQGNLERHIWTVVEDEVGNQRVVPGWHGINALGLLVTQWPWTNEHIEVTWFDHDELDHRAAQEPQRATDTDGE